MPLYGSGGATSAASGGTRTVVAPESYGAARDGEEVYDAAMTNGAATLTSATAAFVPGDVGKYVNVTGAGAANGILSTTILSYQSATQVTLNANSSATISSKHAIWGTDDTTAIRAAIAAAVAACQADKTYYCEVQFSSGTYILGAATTKGGATRGNAQISLPNIEPATGKKVTIVLKGAHDAGAWAHWLQTEGQRSGPVLRTMLLGQTPDGTWLSPSVIGGPTVTLAGGGEFSNIRCVLDGLTVTAPLNPSVIAADLRRCAQADVVTFSALADGTATEMNGSASDSNGIGLYMPMINNNDSANIGVYGCEGFYYGMGCSDHVVARRLGLIYCNTGIFINAASGTAVHGSSIQYISCEATATCIEKSNSSNNIYPINIGQINVESVTTAVKDPANNLRGLIGWADNNAGADPVVTGCAHVKINNMHRARGNITAPAVPATTVASTPIYRDAAVTVSGGTVTVIAVDAVTTGLTSGTFIVPSGKTITITYSVVPTWKWTLL